jgi:hypothetical protein
MGCSSEFVGFKVENQDASLVLFSAFRAKVPFTSGFEKDEFSVRDHASCVHGNGEDVFKEDFSILIKMDNTILPESGDTEEDVGVVEGRIEIQNFSVLFWEGDFGSFGLEKHQMIWFFISFNY